jgi:hypothetical protein
MATLRGLIDGREIDCNATQDVFKHLEKAHRAKLKSDLTNVKLQTKLAPTRKLLELVDQMHPAPGDNQNQQVDNNGNPVNLQNPQLNQQGQPIPNQAPPMKPGMGQPNVQNKSTQIPQKKPAFGNANKTSTKDKLDQDKNKKQVGGKKGLEIHVKAGGPGSGRKPEFKSAENQDKLEKYHQAMTKSGYKYKHSAGDNKTITHVYEKKNDLAIGGRERKSIFERSNGDHATNLNATGAKIDQMNVKKKTKRYDFHDDAGISQMPSRGIGLSGTKRY